MRIIVGLGNPGEQYQKTRHNVGWLALDNFLGDVEWRVAKKFKALIYESGDNIFVKPLTFMNNSGQAVQAILNYYQLLPKKLGLFKIKDLDLTDSLLVIHDDLDIDFGKYKLTLDSRSAGHNGVQSIINHLQTQKFKRLRIGVKTELRERMPADKFVLGHFSGSELEQLDIIFEKLKTEI